MATRTGGYTGWRACGTVSGTRSDRHELPATTIGSIEGEGAATPMSSRTATAALTSQARLALARAASMAEHESFRAAAADDPGPTADALGELAMLVDVIPRLVTRCAPDDEDLLDLARQLAGRLEATAAEAGTGDGSDRDAATGD